MLRGRYAPSPTGYLHIGNARTALLAWLQIRSEQGHFVLRIEDNDSLRSRSNYIEAIISDLKWLGLDWDEGPIIGGPYGPYYQSQRAARYEYAFQQLISQHRVYPCYCSRADIRAMSVAPHGLASEGPIYNGTCRYLSEKERQRKALTKQPSYRFIIPQHKKISYVDGFLGKQKFAAGCGGDFIIKRADGIYGYQLAVVVDDASMHITSVLRGFDLIDSTPRQLWLYEALKLCPPTFSHVPLVLGPDRTRLSKRHGDISLRALREAGIKPEELIGQLAYLSKIIEKPEPISVRELIPLFQMSTINPEPIILSERWIDSLHSM